MNNTHHIQMMRLANSQRNSTPQPPAYDFQTNLSAYWRGIENFLDHSGNDFDGINTSVTFEDGFAKFGYNAVTGITVSDDEKFSFTNGVNDLPFHIVLPTIWLDNTVKQYWITKRRLSSMREWSIESDEVNLYFICRNPTVDNSGLILTIPVIDIPLNTLLVPQFKYDGSGLHTGLKVTFDGGVTFVGTTSKSGTYNGMVRDIGSITIGNRPGNGRAWIAKSRDIAIWKDRVMTDDEMLEIDRRIRAIEPLVVNNIMDYSYYMPLINPVWDAMTQGGAIFDKYLVIGNGRGDGFAGYDLETKLGVNQFKSTNAWRSENNHSNTLFFSDQYHTVGDDFPILYSCSGFSVDVGGGVMGSYIYGHRLQLVGGVFQAEMIHTITIISEDWTDACTDENDNFLWIRRVTGLGEGAYELIKIEIPLYEDGDVTINLVDDVLDSYQMSASPYGASSGQGIYIYEDIMYMPTGTGSQVGQERIVVVDLINKSERYIDLRALGFKAGGSDEPEWMARYNGEFLLGHRDKIYKFFFKQ